MKEPEVLELSYENVKKFMDKMKEVRQQKKVFVVPLWFDDLAKERNMTKEEYVDHVYGEQFKRDVDVLYEEKMDERI